METTPAGRAAPPPPTQSAIAAAVPTEAIPVATRGPADRLQVSKYATSFGGPAQLPMPPAAVPLAGPTATFDVDANRLLTDKASAAYHAFTTYGGLALAARDPQASSDIKEHWQRLQENAAPIAGDMEFLPVSFRAEDKDQAYHLALAGGRTDQGQYRLLDPLTARYYEGADRQAALENFFQENHYPTGQFRYNDAQGHFQDRHNDGSAPVSGVATGWSIGSAVALIGSVVFPPAAPILLPVAATGLIPASYLAAQSVADLADRLSHGQNVSWERWALGAAQVAGCMLGTGALAGALGGGSQAVLAAAAGTGASAVTVIQAERLMSVTRFLLSAGLATTPAEAEAIGQQLQRAAGQPGLSAAQQTAAVYTVLAEHALRGPRQQ